MADINKTVTREEFYSALSMIWFFIFTTFGRFGPESSGSLMYVYWGISFVVFTVYTYRGLRSAQLAKSDRDRSQDAAERNPG